MVIIIIVRTTHDLVHVRPFHGVPAHQQLPVRIVAAHSYPRGVHTATIPRPPRYPVQRKGVEGGGGRTSTIWGCYYFKVSLASPPPPPAPHYDSESRFPGNRDKRRQKRASAADVNGARRTEPPSGRHNTACDLAEQALQAETRTRTSHTYTYTQTHSCDRPSCDHNVFPPHARPWVSPPLLPRTHSAFPLPLPFLAPSLPPASFKRKETNEMKKTT